jgi:hypothetical protein
MTPAKVAEQNIHLFAATYTANPKVSIMYSDLTGNFLLHSIGRMMTSPLKTQKMTH